jgi:hypothetical protein
MFLKEHSSQTALVFFQEHFPKVEPARPCTPYFFTAPL